MARVPERIAAAVDLLQVQPDDHVLEIGCGNGTAAALVCERLGDGQLVAIDRSETEIRRARERNGAHLASGRLTLHVMALEAATLPEASFDTIFAINVNCFWLRAEEPLAAVRRLLKPDGTFFVFYQHPTPARMREIAAVLRTNLMRAGLSIRGETMTGPVYALASTPTPSTPTASLGQNGGRSVDQRVDFGSIRSTNR